MHDEEHEKDMQSLKSKLLRTSTNIKENQKEKQIKERHVLKCVQQSHDYN